jgi:hypothetical protein
MNTPTGYMAWVQSLVTDTVYLRNVRRRRRAGLAPHLDEYFASWDGVSRPASGRSEPGDGFLVICGYHYIYPEAPLCMHEQSRTVPMCLDGRALARGEPVPAAVPGIPRAAATPTDRAKPAVPLANQPRTGFDFMEDGLSDPVFRKAFRARLRAGKIPGRRETALWRMVYGTPGEPSRSGSRSYRVWLFTEYGIYDPMDRSGEYTKEAVAERARSRGQLAAPLGRHPSIELNASTERERKESTAQTGDVNPQGTYGLLISLAGALVSEASTAELTWSWLSESLIAS